MPLVRSTAHSRESRPGIQRIEVVNTEILNAAIAAMEADEYLGFCLDCGAEHGQVEPDAERYECKCCGERKVYGAEQIVLMNCY